MKHCLAVSIALLPSAVLAEQFTPQQMLDAMTKSPENRDVRVHDAEGDINAEGDLNADGNIEGADLDGSGSGNGVWGR